MVGARVHTARDVRPESAVASLQVGHDLLRNHLITASLPEEDRDVWVAAARRVFLEELDERLDREGVTSEDGLQRATAPACDGLLLALLRDPGESGASGGGEQVGDVDPGTIRRPQSVASATTPRRSRLGA